MTDEQAEIDLTVSIFYRTGRAGALRLSDGGGPFGFDIAVALMVDELVRRYGCDAVTETGCFAGDTTFYLARRYPGLPVYSCDTDPACAAFAGRRLRGYANAEVTCEDSREMLTRVADRHARPLAFLDAHWGPGWPLAAELAVPPRAGPTDDRGPPRDPGGGLARHWLSFTCCSGLVQPLTRYIAESGRGLFGGLPQGQGDIAFQQYHLREGTP